MAACPEVMRSNQRARKDNDKFADWICSSQSPRKRNNNDIVE